MEHRKVRLGNVACKKSLIVDLSDRRCSNKGDDRGDKRLHVISFGWRLALHLLNDVRRDLRLVSNIGTNADPGQGCCFESKEQHTDRPQNIVDEALLKKVETTPE